MHRLRSTVKIQLFAWILFAVTEARAQVVEKEELVRYSDPSRYDTYFIQHQVGANQGLYSLGLGYKFSYWEPSFSFGYSPNIRSGAQVLQGNIKQNFKVFDFASPHIQGLIGASLFLNFSPNAFFTVPGKYPDRYYPPNAYFFGIQASLRHHGFFIEASIIDYFLEVAARNENSAAYIGDLLSVGFGYTHDVDFEWSDLTKPFK